MTGWAVLFMLSSATGANADFDAAKKAYANYEMERVLPLLDRALSTSTELHERTQILELEARVHLGQGDTEQARTTFVQLLLEAPNYVLPATSSPKIRSVFESARASLIPVEEVKAMPPSSPKPRVEMPAPRTAFWESWWFWGIVAGAVAGATIVTVAVATSGPDADLGPFAMR